MDTNTLKVLLRVCKSDPNAVAMNHLFNQDALTSEDHAFLAEHIGTLETDTLVNWLIRGAPRPKLLIDHLLEKWPEDAAVLMFFLGRHAGSVDVDALDDLLERGLGRIAPTHWCWLARSLTGMCAIFDAARGDENASSLVAALFPVRRNEQACRAALLDLARQGGALVRGPSWSYESADCASPDALRERASVIAWMSTRGLLVTLSPSEVLPVQVAFPCENDDWNAASPDNYLLRLALRWPGRDPVEGRDWYIDQVLAAVKRGAEWARLLTDIVGESRGQIREPHVTSEEATRIVDEIAWRSFGTEAVAPWIGYAVCRALERGEADAWERATRYLERRDLHFKDERQRTFPWARRIAALHSKHGEMLGQPFPEWIPGWILLNAPLPAEADDDFDERLLSFASAVPSDIPVRSCDWIVRLSTLPLTRPRANRLLVMALSSERNLDLLAPELIGRLADAADPLPPARVPPIDAYLRGSGQVDPARLAAYRKLAGASADERIRRWMRAALDEPAEEPGDGAWSAACRIRWAPDLVPEGMEDEILARARQMPLPSLLSFQREFPELVSDDMIREVAAGAVNDPSRPWAHWDKAHLPEYLVDLVVQRCREPIGATEVVALARWLLSVRCAPRQILSCILDRSPRLEWDWRTEDLMCEILNSRSRWETFGPAIVKAMFADGARGSIWQLVSRATSKRDGDLPHGFVVGIHEAVAVALLDRAAAALEAGDEHAAVPPLHALVALHPPARLSQKLRRLAAGSAAGSEAHDLVELNMHLLKHSKPREAQPADVLGAIQLLGNE